MRKGIEEVLELGVKNGIDDIKKEELKYRDRLPCKSDEMPEGDSIYGKRITMKYFDGTITKEEHEAQNSAVVWKGVYDVIFLFESLNSMDAGDMDVVLKQYQELDKDNQHKNVDTIDVALKLYLGLDKDIP